MSNWKDRLNFFKVAGVPANVQGVEVKFYPVSINDLMKMDKAIKELVSAVAALFPNTKNDNTNIHRIVNGATETVMEGADVDVIALRSRERQAAVARLVDAVASEDTRLTLAELLIASMREEFPNASDRPTPREFLESTTPAAFYDLIQGFVKANKDILGPFSGILEKLNLQEVIESLKAKLPSLDETQEIPGQTSSDK